MPEESCPEYGQGFEVVWGVTIGGSGVLDGDASM